MYSTKKILFSDLKDALYHNFTVLESFTDLKRLRDFTTLKHISLSSLTRHALSNESFSVGFVLDSKIPGKNFRYPILLIGLDGAYISACFLLEAHLFPASKLKTLPIYSFLFLTSPL